MMRALGRCSVSFDDGSISNFSLDKIKVWMGFPLDPPFVLGLSSISASHFFFQVINADDDPELGARKRLRREQHDAQATATSSTDKEAKKPRRVARATASVHKASKDPEPMVRSAAKAKREQAEASANKLKVAATSLLNDSQKVSPKFHSLGGGERRGAHGK
jgi:hypothetical protein